jgi:hypothetical protein
MPKTGDEKYCVFVPLTLEQKLITGSFFFWFLGLSITIVQKITFSKVCVDFILGIQKQIVQNLFNVSCR